MSCLTPELSPEIETIFAEQNEVNEYLEERIKDIPDDPVFTDCRDISFPEDKNESDKLINEYSDLMNIAIEEYGEEHLFVKKFYVRGQCVIYIMGH